jgi:endogenous inhibitor of DNA gyrase (YacG/DUF329 family)
MSEQRYCPLCGEPIQATGHASKRLWCSDRCKRRAARLARKQFGKRAL